MFQRIKGLLSSSIIPTTLWFLLLSTLVSAGVDRGFKWWDSSNDNRDKRIATFIQSANSLDALVGFYVEAVSQNVASSQKAKDQLYLNINDQVHKAQDMERVIGGKEKKDTEEYVKKLDNLIAVLQNPNSSNVLTMKDFWASISEIVVLRNKLSDQLQS